MSTIKKKNAYYVDVTGIGEICVIADNEDELREKLRQAGWSIDHSVYYGRIKCIL